MTLAAPPLLPQHCQRPQVRTLAVHRPPHALPDSPSSPLRTGSRPVRAGHSAPDLRGAIFLRPTPAPRRSAGNCGRGRARRAARRWPARRPRWTWAPRSARSTCAGAWAWSRWAAPRRKRPRWRARRPARCAPGCARCTRTRSCSGSACAARLSSRLGVVSERAIAPLPGGRTALAPLWLPGALASARPVSAVAGELLHGFWLLHCHLRRQLPKQAGCRL